ncbi:MAG TPA: UDP binding domain-containing protein, partial [Tahibacter sp.]|nr:UDP binding domain-containing protein [Tahibacter sp.]
TIAAYDPIAMDEARKLFKEEKRVGFVKHPLAALDGADALAIVTEWKAFRSPDFKRIAKTLSAPVIFDGRNMYEPRTVEAAGIAYYGIGRGRSVRAEG